MDATAVLDGFEHPGDRYGSSANRKSNRFSILLLACSDAHSKWCKFLAMVVRLDYLKTRTWSRIGETCIKFKKID